MAVFTHRKEVGAAHANKFYISCHIVSFSFPVFEEKLALSWQEFLAQFGGNLGLWLGLSFASLVHIPVFLIRVFAGFIGARIPKAQMSRSEPSLFQMQPVEAGGSRSGQMQREVLSLLAEHAARLDAIEQWKAQISKS